MNRIQIAPSWTLPESEATPESVFLARREFLRRAGIAAGSALFLSSIACGDDTEALKVLKKYARKFTKNEKYKLDRPLSKEVHAVTFNNFYEFTTTKNRVWKLVDKFKTEPWQIEIGGLAKKKGKHDLDDILKKLPQEERLYRFRCVETWAMAVPWIGIPMKKFLDWAEPSSKAKYVEFETEWRPKEMPAESGWKDQFPYFEALRMDEAANELTMFATGLYGKQLPKQNGAPLRVIVPWKYGYKSPKSIVKINFVEKQPPTFWSNYNDAEYGFYSNVNPKRAHPRWSQAKEWMLPDKDKKRDTLLFNGYGEQVAKMYKGMDLIKYH
ncbi:MAG: protein-methionine-sulfoxide reductase catalytic subunit MsrP [Planctomycetota bacterium]|jgi:sulfoxide reductase catalytic subunit YedY